MRDEEGIVLGREAEACSLEGTVCVKALGGQAPEHQGLQDRGHVAGKYKDGAR